MKRIIALGLAITTGAAMALASDSGAQVEGRPTFDLDDTAGIADFIASELGL